jgi:hypothetical protein
VALGDSDADGFADFIVTAPGRSSTQVTEIRVFDLEGNRLTVNPLDGTTPLGATFKGGANLALGNLGGSSALDLVVAPRSGRPDLVVINGTDGTSTLAPLSGIKPFGGKFKGNINVAVGDVDSGAPGLELVVAPGGGTVAKVRVYSSTSITGAPLRTITFKGTSTVGLSVATAPLDANPGEEIVVSALTGAPLIKIFSGGSGALLATHNKASLGFAAAYKQGLRVAVADTDEDGRFELLLAPGAGAVPSLRVLELGATLGAPPTELFSVLAQDAFTGFTVATL